MLSPLLTEDDQNLFDYSSRLNIPFKFVPAFAPWQSGIYERMVKIFKPSFKAAIRSRKIELGEFHPLIKECEAFLNSRPLTYVYNIIDSDRISIMTNRLPPTVRSPSSPDFNKHMTLMTNGWLKLQRTTYTTDGRLLWACSRSSGIVGTKSISQV